jgi:hypothetical protein
MTSSRDLHKIDKRKRFAHILAGMIILLHAYERFDTGHRSYIFFLLFGLVFLCVAFFHPILEKKFSRVDSTFFFIEGILSLIIMYEYIHAGKKGLPFTYGAAGLVQLAVAVFKSKKKIAGKSS